MVIALVLAGTGLHDGIRPASAQTLPGASSDAQGKAAPAGVAEPKSSEPMVPPIRRVHPARVAKEAKQKAKAEKAHATAAKKVAKTVAPSSAALARR